MCVFFVCVFSFFSLLWHVVAVFRCCGFLVCAFFFVFFIVLSRIFYAFFYVREESGERCCCACGAAQGAGIFFLWVF
uniref:Putative secreted peptide n=1 Tax=Anopheles braziliensis TaxID=58242 RepID=A0A2M3ZXT5_9DIPT